MEREVDFIIVGQGLAGSTLALELLKRDMSVVVYDEPNENHCSVVAAGLFNPITGRAMAKTWNADLLFPFLIEFYSNAEKKLGEHFFYPMSVYRPFTSFQEQNEWMGKSAEPGMRPYLKQVFTHSEFMCHVYDDLGGLLLSQCGYVDTHLFMKAVRKNLVVQSSYCDEHFAEGDLILGEDFILYKNIKAKKVIYCNGVESRKSVFFKWLPLIPLKGETIHVKVDHEFAYIYNRGVYIVPSNPSGHYKVGATYNTKDFTTSITLEGKTELSKKLTELIRLPYEITNQYWGIRPTTADRRPLLGCRPDERKVVIFNGLGTKGISLAPYFANQLANWLMGQGTIDREVDINRFKFGK
ncbi:MAG: FAD-dependent oxidoreductase [Bacteroidota bacterium]